MDLTPELFFGDCETHLEWFDDNSIDSLVTDPPYGWRFMGKAWDGADIEKVALRDLGKNKEILKMFSDGKMRRRRIRRANAAGKYDLSDEGNKAFQIFSERWAREAYRVLKPGGYVLVFCGPRTYHRMACGVEDAGFEIRDQIQWIFGSGFPKSLDVSKAIDRAAGAEREILGKNPSFRKAHLKTSEIYTARKYSGDDSLTAPSTDAAKQWQGFGTALKPANEPILLARKPLSEKTVAANVLRWGTGALNIDASRIGFQSDADKKSAMPFGEQFTGAGNGKTMGKMGRTPYSIPPGRFPANLVLDEEAARLLDAQSGISKSVCAERGTRGRHDANSPETERRKDYSGGERGHGDSGGASRFFYVAKASKREKNAGLEGMPEKESANFDARPSGDFAKRMNRERPPVMKQNTHPTVKPIKLMRYLCRLITPPKGIILDPFMGSGTTGIAAKAEGFRFIGIEREAEYFEIAKKRLK